MTDQVRQADKSLVLDYWAALDNPDPGERAAAAAAVASDGVRWHGHEPVGSVEGLGRLLSEAWAPLMRSFPDLQWYGPGGIGACPSFEEFENLHQRPWLVAFPDRQVQDLDGGSR